MILTPQTLADLEIKMREIVECEWRCDPLREVRHARWALREKNNRRTRQAVRIALQRCPSIARFFHWYDD